MVATSLRNGGAEKQTVYFARALQQSGFDLRFYYLGRGGHYEAVLREHEIPVHHIDARNGTLRIMGRLIAALRRWKPHVTLVNQFGDLHIGAIAGRLCGSLVLGGVRSNGWYEMRTYGRFSRWMFRAAHGFIANSRCARLNLESQGLPPWKVEVLPNVIDLEEFDVRSSRPLHRCRLPEGVLVAAVGSLIPCKRFDRFMEALAMAREDEPGISGVIAGSDGGIRNTLLERANDLQLGPRVLHFAGECDNVPALLSQATMLVLSSDYEGFPNVILEAMAARLPVIATSAGDAGTVVQHGRTGYVVDPEDIEGLARFIVRLAKSPSIRETFGKAGRLRVEEKYSHETLAGRLAEVLRHYASPSLRAGLNFDRTDSANAIDEKWVGQSESSTAR